MSLYQWFKENKQQIGGNSEKNRELLGEAYLPADLLVSTRVVVEILLSESF